MSKVISVGAGWVTNARHIPALKRSRRAEVVGIIDKNLSRAQVSAKKHRVPHFADTLDAPWTNDVEVFTVGVSPMDHFSVVDSLLDRNKHVLLEKPMCLTVAEGQKLVDKAKSKSRILALVHNFQFARSVVKAKRWIASGRWGKITALQGFQWSNPNRRLPHWYEQLPLGLFYDESPHLLYLLRAFGGTATVRHARMLPSSTGNKTPAQIYVELSTTAAPATLVMNFESPLSEWHLMILLERGSIIVDIFRDILIFIPADGVHSASNILRTSRALVWGHVWGFMKSGLQLLRGRLDYGNDEVVRRFLDAIEGTAPLQDIDAETGLEMLKLQHDILKQCGDAV